MIKFLVLIINSINLVFKAVDKYFQWVNTKYKANRFYQDCRASYIPGETEWNHAAQQALLYEYGYKENQVITLFYCPQCEEYTKEGVSTDVCIDAILIPYEQEEDT